MAMERERSLKCGTFERKKGMKITGICFVVSNEDMHVFQKLIEEARNDSKKSAQTKINVWRCRVYQRAQNQSLKKTR